jgi:hypothetical protein
MKLSELIYEKKQIIYAARRLAVKRDKITNYQLKRILTEKIKALLRVLIKIRKTIIIKTKLKESTRGLRNERKRSVCILRTPC